MCSNGYLVGRRVPAPCNFKYMALKRQIAFSEILQAPPVSQPDYKTGLWSYCAAALGTKLEHG
jgi:hypothetical protein